MSEIQASRHPDSRSGLTLLQPNASPWMQSYGYDAAERLTSIVSPAGTFSYAYDSARVALPGTLTLPSGATIATRYDFMARLTNTTLRCSQQAVLNHHGYESGRHRGVVLLAEVYKLRQRILEGVI